MPRNQTLLYLSDASESECEGSETEQLLPPTVEKSHSVANHADTEAPSRPPYKKNPPQTSRRDLVGKFPKEFQCQHCQRPYRQQHHLLKHESTTCPVVLQKARDKLARAVEDAPVKVRKPRPVAEPEPEVVVRKKKRVVVYQSESDSSSSSEEEEVIYRPKMNRRQSFAEPALQHPQPVRTVQFGRRR